MNKITDSAVEMFLFYGVDGLAYEATFYVKNPTWKIVSLDTIDVIYYAASYQGFHA